MVESLPAYELSLTDESKIGEGTFGDVYTIHSKDKQKVYAAKLLKKKLEDMESEEKLGL